MSLYTARLQADVSQWGTCSVLLFNFLVAPKIAYIMCWLRRQRLK